MGGRRSAAEWGKMNSQNNGKDQELEKILMELAEFAQAYGQGDNPGEKGREESCSLETFTLLLSGISSSRRVPGIPQHMGYETLYHCDTEEDAAQVREHLQKMYGITDGESMEKACRHMFRCGDEYGQLLEFWNGQPPFDLSELTGPGREAFDNCMKMGEQIRPVAGSKGLHGWDYNERIGIYRLAAACRIITDQEFWDACASMAKRMAAIYSSFGEFATSCLCGAVYYMYCENGWNSEGLYGFFHINRQILQNLLSQEGAWSQRQWLQIAVKKYAKEGSEILPLLTDWEEAQGCFATDRIMVDGCAVGYMYREEPNPNMPDSGWRFFAGDESDEYANNPENVGIYALNTLCNYDPDIMPLLHGSYGTAYFRDEKGQFRQEKLIVPEE